MKTNIITIQENKIKAIKKLIKRNNTLILDYFKKLTPKVNAGLRTQMNSKINDIITQLIKQGEPIT